MCGALLRTGRNAPDSAVVDHIEPIELSPHRIDDPTNLWAVCKGCHDGACASIERQNWPDAALIATAKRRAAEPDW